MTDLFYPAEQFAQFIVSLFLGENPGVLGDAVSFFIYDSIKIIILLFVMIFAVGFLRTYLPEHKIKAWLTGRRTGLGNILASLFGALTPFCSCSSIPLFLGFIRSGVPLGISFSFLITSPLVNEYLVVLMLGFFGWKITGAYVLSGILIGVFSGIILGKMNLESQIVKDIQLNGKCSCKQLEKYSLMDRFFAGFREAASIVRKLWLWILVGVGLSAIIHGYVPQEAIQSFLSTTGVLAVPVATLIGIPLYANCVAVVPIAVVIFEKGIPLGTALAFMMATAALSLPEAILLKRVISLKLILLFFGIVAAGIIFTGYLLNFLQAFLI